MTNKIKVGTIIRTGFTEIYCVQEIKDIFKNGILYCKLGDNWWVKINDIKESEIISSDAYENVLFYLRLHINNIDKNIDIGNKEKDRCMQIINTILNDKSNIENVNRKIKSSSI